ncbi:MAG: 5-formyltetrahydrofolate cyclo-ligase [Patescibacteria group bacterium]
MSITAPLSCQSIISFNSLKDEPNPRVFLEQFPTSPVYMVPSTKDTDPFAEAEKVTVMFQNKNVCVLVPGVTFDIHGTRHGRGGGWYDRFLSRLPRSWLKIGVTTPEHLSHAPLKREVWDEPMSLLALIHQDTLTLQSVRKKL